MKIVALGDSLTVGEGGFTLSGSDESATTYPQCLELFANEYLQSHRSDVKVDVLNRGINGDLTSGMLERFSSDVFDEKPDYVIILGGTNDIGWGLDPTVISHNLARMFDAALYKGVGAVACSVPSILGFDELIPPRRDLNRQIEVEAAKREMPFLDLFNETADPQNSRLLEEYSADGLHLNSTGYRQIGKYIFDDWLKVVLRSRGPSS